MINCINNLITKHFRTAFEENREISQPLYAPTFANTLNGKAAKDYLKKSNTLGKAQR
jgi:hypothetical protein